MKVFKVYFVGIEELTVGLKDGFISHFVMKNEFLSKLYYQALVKAKYIYYRGDPIIILTLGKTGSSSILFSLRNTLSDRQVLQLHRYSINSLKEANDFFEDKGRIRNYKRNVEAFALRRYIDDKKNNSNWKINIISLVREPIACNVSAFFQAINHWYSEDEIKNNCKNVDMLQDMVDTYFSEYPHDWVLTWFDEQIKGEFGVDVYAEGFDMEKGYKIYSGEDVNLLVIRTDRINDSAENAICDFLNIDDFKLQTYNEAKDKYYSECYSRFSTTIKFKKSYLEKVYNSDFAKNFFTESEIEKYKNKWERL